MKSVLSSKVLEGELRILDALTVDAFSTKKAKEILKNLSLETKTMIVLPEGMIRLLNHLLTFLKLKLLL